MEKTLKYIIVIAICVIITISVLRFRQYLQLLLTITGIIVTCTLERRI